MKKFVFISNVELCFFSFFYEWNMMMIWIPNTRMKIYTWNTKRTMARMISFGNSFNLRLPQLITGSQALSLKSCSLIPQSERTQLSYIAPVNKADPFESQLLPNWWFCNNFPTEFISIIAPMNCWNIFLFYLHWRKNIFMFIQNSCCYCHTPFLLSIIIPPLPLFHICINS